MKQELLDVIASSKAIRIKLENSSKTLYEKINEIPVYDRILNANKNIVAACSLILKTEKNAK